MLSRFIRVVGYTSIHFYDQIVFHIPLIYDISSVHSSADRHLSCFHFGGSINDAARNILIRSFCVHMYFQFSEEYPWKWNLLGHMVTPCLTFWGTAKLLVPERLHRLQTCILDSAFHVPGIPMPCIFIACQLIGQVKQVMNVEQSTAESSHPCSYSGYQFGLNE